MRKSLFDIYLQQMAEKNKKSKTGKIVIAIILAIVIIPQFIPVKRDNPQVMADFNEDAAVKAIFQRACYDCHSNQTVWPWYSYVAPVSWQVAHDVHEGREHLNFSEWNSYNDRRKEHAREEIREETESGEMPLGLYLVIHSGAKLSEEDKQLIAQWSGPSSESESSEDDEPVEHDR